MIRILAAVLVGMFAAAAGFGGVASDFDGDGKTDRVVVRKEAGSGRFGPLVWYILRSSDGQMQAVQWGYGEDRIVAADYDGDGKTDVAVWRSDENDICEAIPDGQNCQAHFYILRSSDGGVAVIPFGSRIFAHSDQARTHVPFVDDPTVVADYDGDGKADIAVYREGRNAGEQSWLYYLPSTNPTGGIVFVPWGIKGDEPCVGDYDGDGKADPCVRRGYGKNPATFYVMKSSGGYIFNSYGYGSDQIVNADYDGDGKTDFAVIRAQEMVSAAPPIDWFIQRADGSYYGATFGVGGEFGDRPTLGDYDGDGKSDVAVWRPIDGTFYIANASGFSAVRWGIQNDKLINSTGFLAKLPVGWNVIYDKLGSGGQGWGFYSKTAVPADFGLPSMSAYAVSANRFVKEDANTFIRRAEFAPRTLINGVDSGNLATVAGYALRVWDGSSSNNFFSQPMNGTTANHQTSGNFTNPNLGSVTDPVYVSPTGSNRPFYIGWDNLNVSLSNITSTHVSIQLGIDALSQMNALNVYSSGFGGVGGMGVNNSGGSTNYNLPLAYRLITSE